ncbi:hypothetical protein LUZ61_001908 [Rhynchospora tenuis]|uniref:Replication factor A C-terminal domain-containing protein n=1 Tax=Rhynchospora tenuis TaxID=198213 RepID=A0AAD6ER77_9POAL|nr:hypothetical protein LUZ61_001908 [Rhynchospora tenuis]
MNPPVPVASLTLTTKTDILRIHGRPVRIWPAQDSRFGRVYSMGFLFIDHTGGKIQGCIPVTDYQRLSNIFSEENICEISRFTVEGSITDYQVVKHPYMLSLTRETLITTLQPNIYDIPRNYFEFASFDDLGVRITHLKAVTDVIARLVGFGDIIEKNNGPQPSRVQAMYLTDNRTPYDGNPITLHATAETFNIHWAQSSALQRSAPIKMTIQQLNGLYLDAYNENHYQCAAIIMNVNNRFDWHYQSCPECHRKLTQNTTGAWCGHCNIRRANSTPWYKIRVQVADHTGSAQFVMLGRLGEAAVGMTAQTLAAIQQQNNNVPDQLMRIVGKKYLFTVAGKQRTSQQENRTYTVLSMLDVPPEMLALLPQPILDHEVGDLLSNESPFTALADPHTPPHPSAATSSTPHMPAGNLLTYHTPPGAAEASDDAPKQARGKRPLLKEEDDAEALTKNVKRKLEFTDTTTDNPHSYQAAAPTPPHE